jgi:chromosome segregation ATPase
MDNARSDELTQEVLALKAQHAQIESRSNELQEMVDSKSRDIERLKEDVINASKSSNRLEEVEEEFTMAVEILTEERDTARQKEEEYFEELQATSNDLADIQAGYVDLSDRLNDKTDQIFECQEDLDAERYKCSELREQLTKTQKELLEKSKLLLKVRAAKGLDRKEERTTATTPATPSKNPVSAPDSTTSASTNSPTTNPSTATTEMSSSPTQQLQQQEHQENQEQQESSQKDQLIRSLQKQINDLKMNAAFSPAEQVLVDAAGTNAEESSRQLEEATEMMESLREELETSHATTKEYKIQLNRALRERDRTVDETNRDADQRVKMAIDDAKKAQNAVYEQRKEMESMELLLNEAVRKQEIAESAFANVEATEIGEEDIPSRSSRRKKEKDYARGGGVKGVRAVMRKGSSGVGDDLDESYGADDFSDEDGYGEDGFD